MTSRRILLTGATGHLGQKLAGFLVDRGCHVVGLGRRISILSDLERTCTHNRFKGIACDISRPGEIDSAIEGQEPFSTLIHAAAAIETALTPRQLYSQNAVATAVLLEKLKGKIESVIYLSSIDVYGMPQTCPMTEQHPTVPATFYGASKLAGEEYVRLFGQDAGVPTTSLRVSSIYGPGEWLNRAMLAFLKASIAGKPITLMGDGSDLRDYAYVDDVAEGVCAALDCGLEGIFNLGGGTPVSIRDIAVIAQELTSCSAGVEERARVKSRYDLSLDISKLQRATGFSPRVSLRDGMARELEALKYDMRTRARDGQSS